MPTAECSFWIRKAIYACTLRVWRTWTNLPSRRPTEGNWPLFPHRVPVCAACTKHSKQTNKSSSGRPQRKKKRNEICTSAPQGSLGLAKLLVAAEVAKHASTHPVVRRSLGISPALVVPCEVPLELDVLQTIVLLNCMQHTAIALGNVFTDRHILIREIG